ncbi:MAG: class I SAM-dependent methyltransferase [Gemmatimonadota bacterium]
MKDPGKRGAHDAFGHVLLDQLEGRDAAEIIERSDGFIGLSAMAAHYFEEPGADAAAILERARGRVLDIGCGAGRYALYLQQHGHDVVGIDISPLAIEVCRRRGLRDARVISIDDVSAELGRFGTIIMMGNNFGLFGTPRKARFLLKRFRKITEPDARIIAQVLDPYQSTDPDHLAYHAQNRARGRLGGQLRLRVLHRSFNGAWFDYLFVSRAEMEDIVSRTGWQIDEVIEGGGGQYVAVLRRDG